MTITQPTNTFVRDALYVRLAREIAADILPLDKILANHGLDTDEWNIIRSSPHFQQLLTSEIEAWNSAGNTHERVKLKSAAMIEEVLPEVYARVHDKAENLNHKAELLKWLKDLSGMGVRNASVAGTGERLSITINLGADQKLQINRELSPPSIEGVVESEAMEDEL